MTNIYGDGDLITLKVSKELECIALLSGKISASMELPYTEQKVSEELLEEFRLLRCIMERTLRHFSESLFVDYQCEKFGSHFKQRDDDD